jgi:hypothetical protein
MLTLANVAQCGTATPSPSGWWAWPGTALTRSGLPTAEVRSRRLPIRRAGDARDEGGALPCQLGPNLVNGLPVHHAASVLVHLAAKPAAARNWQVFVESLAELVALATSTDGIPESTGTSVPKRLGDQQDHRRGDDHYELERLHVELDIAQDLLLASLHADGMFDHLVFKGGTALPQAVRRQRRPSLHRP